MKTFIKLMLLFAMLGITTSVFSHGMSAEDQARMLNAGYLEYARLGASHMLSGYDHLLFLFGVIFFLTRFADVFKFITAFTIGHCLTLIFATIYTIQANYYLVDAVIALTVCYKAFDNLDGFKKYLSCNAPNFTWMVFIFGLIHGFGLSTRLQQLPLGEEGLVARILAFNVGVEVGQILALSLMLLLLFGWRKTESFARFSQVANLSLIIIGGLLFLTQLHGYQHSVYSDDFPLNQDDHHHAHEDMLEEQEPDALENYPRRINIPEL
ncbi:HupE/UreJ family protein [Aurantivibrio infirmus]